MNNKETLNELINTLLKEGIEEDELVDTMYGIIDKHNEQKDRDKKDKEALLEARCHFINAITQYNKVFKLVEIDDEGIEEVEKALIELEEWILKNKNIVECYLHIMDENKDYYKNKKDYKDTLLSAFLKF